MGTSITNQPTTVLRKEELLLHLKYDQSSLTNLWEAICNEIQNNLEKEDDNTIFRVLIPNFDVFN